MLPFKQLPFLALFLQSSALARSFTGPATVECPTEDWEINPCRPSIVDGRVFSCTFSCPEGLLSTLFSQRIRDTTRLDVPCDCMELLDCPESCSIVGDDGSGRIDEISDEDLPQDFVGPGLLKCPLSAFIEGCDFAYKEDCTFDPTTCSFPDVFDIFGGIFVSQISVPLPCSCMEVKSCPASCEFEADESEAAMSTSFNGVGTVSCPVEDYLAQPCLPLDFGGKCLQEDTECVDFDVTSFLFPDEQNTIKFPLPCGCLSVAGCPATCSFAEGLEEVKRSNFTGSGTVSCPLNSYLSSPCVPRIKSGSEQCESAVCLASAYTSIGVQNSSAFEISLPCDCLELQECSADCTFIATDSMELARTTFSGPGSVTCPFSLDSIVSPCQVLDADDCECSATNVLNLDGVNLNLPCECSSATCSDACVFSDELASFPFQETDLEQGDFFQGPGIVTCPTADYEENPCSFNTLNAFECLVEGNSCLQLAFDFLISEVDLQGDEIQIPIDCDCIQLVGCPATCSFAEKPSESTIEQVQDIVMGGGDVSTPAVLTSTLSPQTAPVVSPVDESPAASDPILDDPGSSQERAPLDAGTLTDVVTVSALESELQSSASIPTVVTALALAAAVPFLA